MSITLYRERSGDLETVKFHSLIFPAGEPHVEITQPEKIWGNRVVLDARISSMNEFMTLMVLTDAVKRQHPGCVELFIPYFPGGRQDRVEYNSGHGLSAKVFAQIINQQKYDQVYIVDPHSDVTTALLDRVVVMDHTLHIEAFLDDIGGVDYLICPDAGAEKRVNKISKQFNSPVVYAHKSRDIKTGKLSGVEISRLLEPGNYLVVDDLCDGGGTFIGLAETFYKRASNSKLFLWVTHGIFSKGVDDLLKYYEHIGTTDSFETNHPKVTRYTLFDEQAMLGGDC